MQDSMNIFSILQMYNGTTWFIFLFLAAVAYLLWKGDKEARKKILIVLAGSVVLIFNDLSLYVVSKVVGSETYYRFLWMIPLVPILGYMIVDLFIRQKTALKKTLAAVMAAVLLILGGTSCLDRDSFKAPAQVHYVDPEIVKIAELIEQDKDKEYPMVAAPINIAMPIRLTNSNIRNYIKRNTYLKEGNITGKSNSQVRQRRLYRIVNGERLSAKQLKRNIKWESIDYIIIATEHQMDDLMVRAGCSILAETGNFTIYRC